MRMKSGRTKDHNRSARSAEKIQTEAVQSEAGQSEAGKGKHLIRVAISLISLCLLLILYRFIWGFSDEVAEVSGGRSIRIARELVELLDKFTHLSGSGAAPWSGTLRESLALYFEHPIRKAAHFAEYAVMGTLVHGIWRPLKNLREVPHRGWYVFSTLWVCISAAADEFHQTFIPGRFGGMADVLLDTAGGIAGLLFCFLMTEYVILRMAQHRSGS